MCVYEQIELKYYLLTYILLTAWVKMKSLEIQIMDSQKIMKNLFYLLSN
jgi:hypothetical protein